MTLFCERDPNKPGNHCVKCGTKWTDGTPTPGCSGMEGFIEAKGQSFRGGEIVATNISGGNRDPNGLVATILGLQRHEPFFTLHASDLLSDYLVEEWARKAEQNGCDPKRVRAAREKAAEMRAWGGKRGYPA